VSSARLKLFQKEVKSNLAVIIVCGNKKGPLWKRFAIQGGGQEMAVMVGWWQSFNLGEFASETWRKQHNFTWIVVSKILLLAYYHSHLLEG